MKPEGGWYAPLAGFFCAALLAAASLLFVGMLGTAIGPFRFDALLEDGGRAKPLGLWHPASARALGGDAALERWRGVLPEGIEVIESAELAGLAEAGVDPIVVSDARALAQDELDGLRAELSAGRSVVIAGWIAVQDARGRPRPRAAMAELLGIVEVSTCTARRLERAGRGPLASGLQRSLELPSASPVPALSGRGELYWADAPGATDAHACGALRLVRLERAALLWLAALPPAAPRDPAWRALYGSALAAVQRRPAHELLDAPSDPALRGLELEAWTAARAAVHTKLESITLRRMRLRVTNAGEQSARGLAVRIHMNRPLSGAAAQSSTLFTSAPRIQRGPEHVDLELPAIPPGATRTYILDVEP